MNGSSDGGAQAVVALPADDLGRGLVYARPNQDHSLRHVSIAGSTYTFLLTGADTAGRYCLIDMHVPPGGGPPPHRDDFEEMFGRRSIAPNCYHSDRRPGRAADVGRR